MHMKILVIGCGFQSYGAALDLAKFVKPSELILADFNLTAAQKLQEWLKYPQAKAVSIDAGNVDAVAKLAAGCSLILNATPYKFAVDITKAAIQAKVPMVDLGGDTDMVLKQLEYSEQAKSAGITIIPDCGMGPGITNVTVGHAMELLDEADEILTRDGGLPQNPVAPLNYVLLFAIETLTNEYTGKTTAVRNGKIVEIDSLTEIETIEMPAPIGKVEATHGMGMLSTLPWTYQGRIKNMDNKFVRYPGHLQFIDMLRKAGFYSREVVQSEKGPIEPRAATKAILEKCLTKPGTPDVSIIQTVSRGRKGSQKFEITHEIMDFSDPETGLTSMARTTGFSAAIAGQMIMDGRVKEKGVIPPELALPKLTFFEELQKRGIKFNWSMKTIS